MTFFANLLLLTLSFLTIAGMFWMSARLPIAHTYIPSGESKQHPFARLRTRVEKIGRQERTEKGLNSRKGKIISSPFLFSFFFPERPLISSSLCSLSRSERRINTIMEACYCVRSCRYMPYAPTSCLYVKAIV